MIQHGRVVGTASPAKQARAPGHIGLELFDPIAVVQIAAVQPVAAGPQLELPAENRTAQLHGRSLSFRHLVDDSMRRAPRTFWYDRPVSAGGLADRGGITPLKTGALVAAGRYRVVRAIGQGGM